MAVSTPDRPEVLHLLLSTLQQLVNAGSEDMSTDAIFVEMYGWPDDATLLNYYQLLKNTSAPDALPPLRMTEISTFKYVVGLHEKYDCIGPKVMGSRFDPTFDSALDIARFIWQWSALINAEFYGLADCCQEHESPLP